jgi:hypothetical protein
LSDFDKLPDTVPKGFIAELKKQYITENKQAAKIGCTQVYTIEIVSPLNVRGSSGYREVKNGKVVQNSQLCGGGGYNIWGVKDGKWIEATAGNDAIYCDRLLSPKIYSEFVSECVFLGQSYKLVPNPNGKINAAL